MTKNHANSIKDDDQYESLRERGMSKEKAARIANTPRIKAGKKGGSNPPYEEWNKDKLYKRAQELDIHGRADMSKDDLIQALRNH